MDGARPRIVVTGATGTVGGAVVRHLAALGAEALAAARRPERVRLPPSATAVRFDFDEPATVAPALAGADGLFLMRPPAVTDAARVLGPVIDAAEAAGVRRIAFLSVLGADKNPWLPHRAVETRLDRSTQHTLRLRAGYFMQNLSEVHAADVRAGEIVVPAGNGRTAFVDADDVGEAAARWLAEQVADPALLDATALDLTGAEALTYGEVAALLADVLGRPVVYRRPGVVAFLRRALARPDERAMAWVMAGLYTTARLGLAARVAPDLARVLGRAPTSFRAFAERERDAWR